MTTHQDHADLPRRTMPLPGVLLDSGPILGEERARWLLGDQGSFIPRPGKKPAPGVLDEAWRRAGGCAGTWRKGCWKLCSWLPPQPSALKLSAHLQQRDGRSEWRRDGFSTWLDSHPAPIDAPFQRSPLHGGGFKIAFHHLTNTESHYLCFCNLLKSDINIILVLFIRSALHLYSSK